jgi:hypothetical protein
VLAAALAPLTAVHPPPILPARNAKAVIARIVTPAAMTQPRTVRNLVHSACTRCQKLSRGAVTGKRYGVTAPVGMMPPPPGTGRSPG